LTIEQIPDPNVPEFGAEWDAAWEKNLFSQALERVRSQIDERNFQIFDLSAVKGWRASDVAQTLRISVARVYLTKHRVSALLKKEARFLERKANRSL
jgi:RNA polymerase sigma-70 factor (ECF subfamily)